MTFLIIGAYVKRCDFNYSVFLKLTLSFATTAGILNLTLPSYSCKFHNHSVLGDCENFIAYKNQSLTR